MNSYENDSILVSSQDGTINQASGITTEYYNELVMAQAENYEQCAEMKASYEILSNRILKLQEEVRLGDISQEVMNQEAKVFNDVEMLYQIINDQMLEINQMPFYRVFLDHTAAQEKSESYLKTGGKNIMIGATVGIAIVFLWWFMAALIPEIVNENEKRKKKELTM